MLRSIAAVIASYVLWSVLWVACNSLLKALGVLPADDTIPVSEVVPLSALLLGSFVFSIIAGYVVVAIKKSNATIPVVVLGGLLLASGIVVELQYWKLMPIWYHIVFLAALIPMCFVGARIKKPKQAP